MARPIPGALIAVGGAEDKRGEMRILRRALDHAPPTRRVAIIPSASADPLWSAQLHVEAFAQLGATSVEMVDVRDRAHASQPEQLARVREADLVYMTGGDQARLSALLSGTPLRAALREKVASGGVVAGTSAGAAAMSAVMIAEGATTLRKGDVRLARGLGLLAGAIVDTHFAERGRFARLMEAVATHPGLVGIGLGEDTAIVVREGEAEVVGGGSVVVMDAREMIGSNARRAEHAEPLDVERMIVHAYSHGRSFRLDEGRVATAARRGSRALA